MNLLANVLIAGSDPRYAETLLVRLRDSGYDGRCVHSGAEALQSARQDRTDVVLAGPDLADMEVVALAERLKQDAPTSHIPVFLMAHERNPGLVERMLAAGIDDLIIVPFAEDVLLARMRPLGRLATMHAELHERAAVAADFGVVVDTRLVKPSDTGYQVMVAGTELDDVEAVLAGDCTVTTTDNLFVAEDQLTRRNFDAAVLVAGRDHEEVFALCSQIRNNPRLFNLPVLLVDDTGGQLDGIEPYRRGASRVVTRPIEALALRSAVISLVRRQRLRWNIREVLVATQQDAVMDRLAGVHSRAFLDRYLARRVANAKLENRHLTLVFFNVPNVDSVRRQFGDEPADHLLFQLGRWINGLLRVEDVTARWQSHEFCAVLPDTPIEEAEIVMHRIAGVLAYTDFAVKDVYQPVKVWLQVGCAQLGPDDDLASLVAKARHRLD